jgi:hypothetical protein
MDSGTDGLRPTAGAPNEPGEVVVRRLNGSFPTRRPTVEEMLRSSIMPPVNLPPGTVVRGTILTKEQLEAMYSPESK